MPFKAEIRHVVPTEHVCLMRLLIDAEQRGPSGASRQAAALRREQVHVDQGSMGEYSIDLATYGWFPDVLPSEAAELSSDEDDGNESEADERGDVDRPRS